MPSLFQQPDEDDEDYGRWLQAQLAPEPSFTPMYSDAATSPIALDVRPEESPAYGDRGRPRAPLAESVPTGVTPPNYWKGQPGESDPPKPSTTSSDGPSTWDKYAAAQTDAMAAPSVSATPSRDFSRSSKSGSDDAGMMLALFADMAINRGRGGQDIINFYGQAPDRDLDREYKRAQIENLHAQATRPRGMTPEQLELQRMRLDQADRRLGQADERFSSQLDRDRFNQWAKRKKIEDEEASRDPESEVSKRAVQTATELYPTLAGKFSGRSASELGNTNPALRAAIQEDQDRRRVGIWQYEEGVRQGNRVGLADYTDTLKQEGEERATGRQAEETSIPGYRQLNRVTDDQAKTARNFISAIDEINAQATQLEVIQRKLGAKGILGRANDVLDEEASYLLAESRQRQLGLESAIRQLSNWGVPQEYELEKLKEAYPPSDSITGVLAAGRGYRAAANIAAEQAQRKLRTYGYAKDDDLGVTNGPLPKVDRVIGKQPKGNPKSQGIRIRDPKTGRTGMFHGTPEDARAKGFEVVQ